MKVTVSISLRGSKFDREELEQKIQAAMDMHQSREISNFIVFLIRVSGASTWDQGKIEVTED